MSLEIREFGLNSRSTISFLCESVEFFVKIAFWSLDTPPFWNRGQSIDFCDLVFEIEQGLCRAPTTAKWLEITIIGFFA